MRSAAGESSSSSSALPSTLATEHDPLLESRRKDKSPLRPPPTSQPSYGSTPPAEPHWTEPIRYRLFFLFVVLLGLSCVAALLLLLMTPDFAQRSFKDGVEFRFREASILSSDDHQQDVLSLHVAGDLALKDAAYSLARKAAWLFGDLRILDSAQLQVYHAGDVMGSLDLPGLALARQSNTTQFDFVTDFVITDPKALMAFAQQAVEAKNVTWRIVGPVAVKIGWLFSRLTMDLDKEVFLQGNSEQKRNSQYHCCCFHSRDLCY
ncbi:hypothetical protein BCR43DRAFT_315899 [Syncephalastrum racemosum]|uniref:Uncharacterized protein n=1 Tax=Syncephalastrum racemosum TaxID=13706 RepID=A0A1X2HB81_SYNRA|nr:hypothetical protein BCR43DRAFT_315899 [Syncephalastrum racemosum]